MTPWNWRTTHPRSLRALLATLLYVVRAFPLLLIASVRLLTAGVATDLARELQALSLDPNECYRVIDLNLTKEDIKIYLTSGYLIFTKPIGGFRQGAVFVASTDELPRSSKLS